MKIDEEVEDIVSSCHIYVNDNDPLVDVNLGTDEDPRPTYLSAFLEVDEEISYINILKEYRNVITWCDKEMQGSNP